MNRRQFISGIALGSLAAAARQAAPPRKRIAITMDDPNTNPTPLLSASQRNAAILETLERSRLEIALFVCGSRVDDATGWALLQQWNDRGHILANHTYSHPYFPNEDITVEDYTDDIARGEVIVAPYSRFQRLFRFPFLKEGSTLEKRDGVRAYLLERGYRMGYVTIDASDWYVDSRMAQRLDKDPDADVSPYRDFYLQHLWERTTFYDELALEVLGRPINHTLLIHHSLLNAMFLEDVVSMYRDRGWELIDASGAYEDPIFSAMPDIVPAGESIVWALAKQAGRYEDRLRYPGEDSVYEEEAMDRLGL